MIPPSVGSSGMAAVNGILKDGLRSGIFPLVFPLVSCPVGLGKDVGEVAARVSPRDFGIAKIRTCVGILSVCAGGDQANRGETKVQMFKPRRAVR